MNENIPKVGEIWKWNFNSNLIKIINISSDKIMYQYWIFNGWRGEKFNKSIPFFIENASPAELFDLLKAIP